MGSNKENEGSDLPIDRGYAWVTATAGMCLFGLVVGGYKCQGIIFVEVHENFPDLPRSGLIWVFSLMEISCVTGPITSFLSSKFGHRPVLMAGVVVYSASHIALGHTSSIPAMFMLYGLPVGMSATTIYMLSLLAPAPYFDKKQATAFGLVSGGAGIGFIAISYVLRVLFDNFGFSGALLLFGGIVLQFLCLASLMRPISFYKSQVHPHSLEEISQETDSLQQQLAEETTNLSYDLYDEKRPILRKFNSSDCEKNTKKTTPAMESVPFNWRLMCEPKTVIFVVSNCIHYMGGPLIYTFLPPFAAQLGIPKVTVSTLFGVFGTLECLFRPTNGYLADRRIMSAFTQFMIALIIAGCSVLFGTLLSGMSAIAGLVVILLGMSTCGTSVISLTPVVLRELVGKDQLDYAVGIQQAGYGLAALASIPIIGFMQDTINSWKLVYLYFSGCLLTGGLTLVPCWLYKLVLNRRGRL